MKADKYLDSNGNRVNLGKFDSNGLNVNNWNDDNRNDNIGLASSRYFFLCLDKKKYPHLRGYFSYRYLIDLIHPPSIFPISSSLSSKTIYFLISKDLTSFANRISIFKIKILLSILFNNVNFLSLCE